MSRLALAGMRMFIPRGSSILSRPLLPVSTHFVATQGARASPIRSSRTWLSQIRIFSYTPLRQNSPSPTRSPDQDQPPGQDAPLSQRLKYLIKRYGWYALGVYILFSAVDFSVAFAAINVIGADQVSAFTHAVKDRIGEILQSRPPEPGTQETETAPAGGRDGFYAMLILAYTVHKTLFFPFRVGLTAAFTPRLVKWLSARGWAGGEGTRRAGRELRERIRRPRDEL